MHHLHSPVFASWVSLISMWPVMMESLVAFKRAGANGVLTYFALEAARLIKATK
jgi:delta-aminolevulinic acid dehydratase/porphobilinogen synthase